MTGIFQLFDRQHMLTGGRRTSGPRWIPAGNSHLNGERESNKSASVDRQRVSTESSRASLSSSSRSSSLSSPECNGAVAVMFSEIPCRQTIDLQGVVKDSMYREIQGLSVKLKTEEEGPVKYRDQRAATPADLKESLRALAKLQEVSRSCNEARELTRSASYHFKDGLSFSVAKDAPRFSYDGRDMNRTPYDDVSRSSLKLKDLPRLSLDSREGSIRSLNMVKDDGNFPSQKHATGNQARPPSVVAKLMGLETLPDSRSSPTSPRWRSPDCSIKPMSRFPIEPAPWRQIDGTKGSQKSASRRSTAKASTTFPSVYSEIEKRLKDLEFNQSGKDLRALKQILEAMQVKGLLETSKEGQDSNFTTHDEQMPLGPHSKRNAVSAQSHESAIVIMKPVKLVEKSGIPAASVISLDGLTGLPKFPGSGSRRASKDLIFKSRERTNGSKEGNAGTGKSSGSMSPRIQQQQQKKLEVEKRWRPPTTPDSSRSTRQSNKQQSDSRSPGGRRRAKLHNNYQKTNDNYQKTNDDPSEAGVELRNLTSREGSERSPRTNGKANEVMLPDLKSASMLNEDESGFAPAEYSSPVSVLENVVCKQDSPRVKYVGKMLNVEASTDSEMISNAIQQSSVEGFAPISADSSVAFEINRKKLRNIDNLVQKLRRLNSTHDDARTDYIASLCENTDPDHRYISEILLASGLLLRDLTSSLTEFQFHRSGHPINPELFLVLEQTKASATSKPKTNKTHRKLIFDAVNEILASKLSPLSEPWTRPGKLETTLAMNAQKLLRDLCSEIDGLHAKNPKCSSSDEEKADDDWKSILHEDVLCRSGGWMEREGEISCAVLDIERLIFKDLVNEVVTGESAGLKAKPRKPK